MKIAVTSTGPGLDSSVDPRFGRCAYFIMVDTESGVVAATANPFLDDASGAGTQAAQWVLEQGTEVLMTGNCGPKAAAVLADAEICVIEGVFGNVGAVTSSVQGASARGTSVPTRHGAGLGPGLPERGPNTGQDRELCRGVGGWHGQGDGRRGQGGGRRRQTGGDQGPSGRC